jgi:hypothetical protein
VGDVHSTEMIVSMKGSLFTNLASQYFVAFACICSSLAAGRVALSQLMELIASIAASKSQMTIRPVEYIINPLTLSPLSLAFRQLFPVEAAADLNDSWVQDLR